MLQTLFGYSMSRSLFLLSSRGDTSVNWLLEGFNQLASIRLSDSNYHGSVTCRLRRHSLPSSFLRDNTDPRVESNIMLIPTVNQNSTDVHSNKNDMLDVLSVDSTQTDSSVVRLDDSIESSSQRKPTPHTDANQFIVNTQNSNDLCPKTARCLSPQSDNNGGSHNNTDFTLHDSDLNCLKEVHLWLTNPDRSIIANNVITRLNTLSTKSSVNLSNCQSTYKQQLSHAINPYFNSDVKQQQKSETSSCMSQTPTDNDAGEDGYRSKLSDNYQSDSQSCINITKTLTASEGLSVYKDFIQSSVDSISCLPSISPSSLTDPIYSQSSCSSSCAYNSRVTTTTCSNFRFGSEKCTKSITDYCHLVPKRHSSGSSPISTPPSEESGSDSAALKPPSPDYWTPKNSSHYTHRMIYTPYQSYSHTFPPVIEDFPSLSSLRSVINAESSNISTKHNKVNVNHCGNGDQNHRNTTNTVSTSNDNGGSNNNTLTSQSSYTVISNAASSCPGESSILPQNCQSTSEELRVDVGLHLKDDEDADNRRSHLDSIGSVHFETTINSNPSNCNRMMITNSTVDSHSSSLSRTSSTTITTTNTTTSANNNSNNFSISPHYWISPQGPIPIPPSALYPPYMLPSPVVIENSQSIQRLPMIYQWTVHPCIPTNGISNSNNPGTSFVPYLPSYVNIVTNDITKSEKVNLPEIVTAIGSHSPPQESNDDEVDEMKTKLSVPTIHSSTNITDNSITVNKNDNNSNNHYNVSATDLPLGSFIDTVRCTSTCLELHHNTITPSSTIGIFTQPCILLPSLSADTAVDGGITVANLPQPVSKTCVNLLKPSLCRTSDETQIALCSLTPPSLSSSVQTIATITTTTGSIITNNNSNNDFYTLQLNAAMKRLNDELDLAVVNDTKIQISNGTIVHSLPITPITSVTTTIVAAGAATTIPRESQIHSSGRFISHAVNRASRSNVSSTEEPLTDPVVTSVESNEFLDSVNCTRSSGQGLSANETFFNSTWFYPRFITRPDSSNPSVCNTSITQLNYPTRGYSPMTTFNNPILSRGYVQPQIANTFYCAQHSGLTLIPTPVTSHSSFISSIPNPSMHFQHPPPIFGFIPNPPTSNISVDSYRGIPTVSSNSVKSNICSITQSSTASLDPMSTTALLTNNLFHVQSLPLLHNLVLHPPLHPAFPPPLPNVANNSNNMPSMTISSLSTMNGPRILSCYNCGQPGHKANTCPSRWSSQQLSENGFSLNYAPRK
ncbi:unnamed protein product [Heterobilharzia americana]|nr:unnamed protein product [Heterobilharzia americana]